LLLYAVLLSVQRCIIHPFYQDTFSSMVTSVSADTTDYYHIAQQAFFALRLILFQTGQLVKEGSRDFEIIIDID